MSAEELFDRRFARVKDRQIYRIAVGNIRPNPYAWRGQEDQEKLEELSASIRACGLLQPILVRRVGKETYELIAGERRLQACQQLGLTHVEAVVFTAYERDVALWALVENTERKALDEAEEIQAYLTLLEEHGFSHEELAQRLGKTVAWLHSRISHPDEKEDDAVEAVPINVSRETNEPLLVGRVRVVCRDPRLYLNSIHELVHQMQQNGISVDCQQNEDDAALEMRIKIGKEQNL